MTDNLEKLSASETPFFNGIKIPLDEVFILPATEFEGKVLAESSMRLSAEGQSEFEALRNLKDVALTHIANALTDVSVVEVNGEFTVAGRLLLVAVPIKSGEISPVNTLFRFAQHENTVPKKFFFTPKKAVGSAGKPTLETCFVSLEAAEASACVRAFKANTAETSKEE